MMDRRGFLGRMLAGALALFAGAPALLRALGRAPVLRSRIDRLIDSVPTEDEHSWPTRYPKTPFTLRSWPGTLYPDRVTPAQKEWASLSWADMRGRVPPS